MLPIREKNVLPIHGDIFWREWFWDWYLES